MRNLYKDEIGNVFEFDDEQVAAGLVPQKLIKMGEAEVAVHLNPVTAIDKEAIASRRYEAEIRGINIDGLEVNTDDRSKLLINGAALEATIDPEYKMKWKTPVGFVELTGQQVIFIARAVRAHVQSCFDREAELISYLEAGTLTNEMLEEGWPNERPLHFMA